jgi:hypothetical protein
MPRRRPMDRAMLDKDDDLDQLKARDRGLSALLNEDLDDPNTPSRRLPDGSPDPESLQVPLVEVKEIPWIPKAGESDNG